MQQEQLHVQQVKKTTEKVDAVAFHPTLPWIAYSRRDNFVGIWDYKAEQVHEIWLFDGLAWLLG